MIHKDTLHSTKYKNKDTNFKLKQKDITSIFIQQKFSLTGNSLFVPMGNTASQRRQLRHIHPPPQPPQTTPPPQPQGPPELRLRRSPRMRDLNSVFAAEALNQGMRVGYVEHKYAVNIKSDVNLMKESLRVVPDEDCDGKFLVEFTLNADAAGSITVMYFAKVAENVCQLKPMKKNLLPPVTVHFQKGLGQKIKQPSGTGIDFSMFEDAELLKESRKKVVPLAIKAEAFPVIETGLNRDPAFEAQNSQITLAVFEKRESEYLVRAIKQILWMNGTRYELHEIYGIGNLVETDIDMDDPGKVCVICLSEPRETTTFPCLHMCMCRGCAKVLRLRTTRCPMCRQRIEKILEIKANNCPAE